MVKVNRDYHPEYYDKQFERGRNAALANEPKEPKNEHGQCFNYSFAGLAWLDGYENAEKKP